MNKTENFFIQLDKLPILENAYISSVDVPDTVRRRLFDLGFVPGTSIMPIYRSPFGDPVAYKVMGSIIALRNSIASGITVATGEQL